jgi:hypothetical protein
MLVIGYRLPFFRSEHLNEEEARNGDKRHDENP